MGSTVFPHILSYALRTSSWNFRLRVCPHLRPPDRSPSVPFGSPPPTQELFLWPRSSLFQTLVSTKPLSFPPSLSLLFFFLHVSAFHIPGGGPVLLPSFSRPSFRLADPPSRERHGRYEVLTDETSGPTLVHRIFCSFSCT